MTWTYRCPGCETTTGVHAPECEHYGTSVETIENAYLDIVGTLAFAEPMGERFARFPYDELRDRVNESPGTRSWTPFHNDVLAAMKRHRLVNETDAGITLTPLEDRGGEIVPTRDPMRTIYECGPVDGAKDYAVYAMVSWCEMHDLTWDQTTAFVERWLTETAAWARLSWGESSIDELLEGKRHVHEEGLGWMERAKNATAQIDRVDPDRRLDANDDAGNVDPSDLT